MVSPTFWNDQDKAKEIIQELKTLNTVLKPFEDLVRQADNLARRSNWPTRPGRMSSTRKSARPASRRRLISRPSSSARC